MGYIMNRCKEILRRITYVELPRHARYFRKPFTTETLTQQEFEDYKIKVLHPMDFSTIERKLDDLEYLTIGDFTSDIKLIFENVKEFISNPWHDLAICSRVLGVRFEEEIDKLIEDEIQFNLDYGDSTDVDR